MKKQPNILILYCDQMQHNRMGFVDGIAHTPNLDRLAAEGIHFTHAITQQGQCVPSRAVLLTGQSAHECGVMINYGFYGHRNMLTTMHNTLPKVLKEVGYETAWFGKGHLGSPLKELGFDYGLYSEHLDLTSDKLRRFYDEDCVSIDETLKFLRSRKKPDNPLFLTVSTNAPHPPFRCMDDYIDWFPESEMKLEDSYYEENFTDKPEFQRKRSEWALETGMTEAEFKKSQAYYYSMIAQNDELLGLIIDEFKRQGKWDNTIVLFTSDHGEMLGAHRIINKGTFPYDELYRIPCILKPATGTEYSRRVIDDLISSQAYAGTLLKLAGLDVPKSFTGGNFAAALERDCHPENEYVFFEHYASHWGRHPFYGIRTRTSKYVRYYGEDNTEELYDLGNDPLELNNKAFDPAWAEMKNSLKKKADQWWRNTRGKGAGYYETPDFIANKHNQPKVLEL